ncbi:MAG: hypothetical protein AAFN76_14420 [Pseudomonadota bacterium]
MKIFSTIALLGTAGLMSCTSAEQGTVSRLGATPIVSGGAYSTGGGLSVAAEVREAAGKTLVCGVFAQSKNQSVLSKHGETIVLGRSAVFLGREALVRNINFFREVAPSPDYGNQDAGCVTLDRTWSATDATKPVIIRIPRQVVSFDGGDPLEGGSIVTFKQTGPEA